MIKFSFQIARIILIIFFYKCVKFEVRAVLITALW